MQPDAAGSEGARAGQSTADQPLTQPAPAGAGHEPAVQYFRLATAAHNQFTESGQPVLLVDAPTAMIGVVQITGDGALAPRQSIRPEPRIADPVIRVKISLDIGEPAPGPASPMGCRVNGLLEKYHPRAVAELIGLIVALEGF